MNERAEGFGNVVYLGFQDAAERMRAYAELVEEVATATDEVRDTISPAAHTAPMTDPISRPELDAKLEAIEARMDARVARIENAVSGFQAEAQQFRTELSSAKWWAIGTAIAVLTVFLGTLQWGLSAQKEENARFSSYIREDVKDISSAVQEMSKSVTEIRIKTERLPDQKQQ